MLHSSNNFIFKSSPLKYSIKGYPEQPLVICVINAKCLWSPTFPPSGLCIGHNNPHCVEFNNRGPTILAASPGNGTLVFRN